MIRRLACLLLGTTLLAACGGTPVAVQPTTAPAVAPTSAPTENAAPTIAPTSAPISTVEPTVAPTEAVTNSETPVDGVFPVTIEHKFGSTTITKVPERIVTVGLTDQDALIALGIVPVGVTEWFGKYPSATGPWAQDDLAALGGTKPVVVGDASAVNFETITALQPDLILALYAGLEEKDYDLLAKIAPTVAQPAEYVNYGIPWQELTRKAGQAVGKAAQAEALIAGIDKHFAQARAEHPEFVGASAVAATPFEGISIYSREDPRSRTITSLGFEIPTAFNEIVGTEFYGNLSFERADLMDLDVVVWDTVDLSNPPGGPIYQILDVHTQGREVVITGEDDPIYAAYSFVSVLSIPFLVDGIVPRLAKALDGNPATSSAPLAGATATSDATTTATETAP